MDHSHLMKVLNDHSVTTDANHNYERISLCVGHIFFQVQVLD